MYGDIILKKAGKNQVLKMFSVQLVSNIERRIHSIHYVQGRCEEYSVLGVYTVCPREISLGQTLLSPVFTMYSFFV